MNNYTRAIFAVLAIVFTAMIGWASLRGDFGAEFAAITNMPWGQVTLVDLYLGFALYSGAVWLVEERMSARLLWALPIIVIGNAWAFIWVAVRWDKIMARVGRKPS
jgi:hypothetical protein